MAAPEPLLLLPGLACDGRLWAPQIAAFSGPRAVQVGQIAHAESIEALADAVLAEAPPRFALAGLSMGGIVAMAVLARAPERVSRAALIATDARADHPKLGPVRASQIARAGGGAFEQVLEEALPAACLHDGPGRAGVLALARGMGRALGPAAFIRQTGALAARPDAREGLARLRLPVLVLCGRADTLCPVRRHEEIAALIPGARLAVLEEAGHLPVLEAPEACNAELAGWLEAGG